MHQCSSTHGSSVGSSCSCGWYQAPSNSFSMFFSMPNHQPYDDFDPYQTVTSSSSSVDCTLSLGTPSTRQSNNNSIENRQRSSTSCVWDLFHTKKPSSKSNRGSSSGSTNNVNGDPLLARRCANCDTTSTPLWRNGPRGPKSLCNACGIRYKKEERRAASTTSSATATVMDPQHYFTHPQQHSWGHQGNEFRFIEDNDHGSPFLSWRLNVPDRSGLVHDYS